MFKGYGFKIPYPLIYFYLESFKTNILKNTGFTVNIPVNRTRHKIKLVNTTLTHEIWESQYEGKTVQFMKNIFTNEISVNAHHFAQCIGYKSLDDMMLDDNVLDACNEIKEETGVFPITKQVF